MIFLIVTRAVSALGLSRREAWWKDAEILMLRHQLAVALRERPRAHSRLTWPDRAWLALLAGTLPADRLAMMRLIEPWIVQQARNLLMDLEDAGTRAKFVLHDRDASFTQSSRPTAGIPAEAARLRRRHHRPDRAQAILSGVCGTPSMMAGAPAVPCCPW
ncbi:MAG TPA: hypothetical protein VIJ71_03210 [Mycobacteriales bacterium]